MLRRCTAQGPRTWKRSLPEVVFTDAEGRRYLVEAETGRSLMRAARAAEVPGIEGLCGGCMNCATCHVFVDEQWLPQLPPPTPEEVELLDALVDCRPNSRLSCQLRISPLISGLIVEIPVTQG